MSETRFTSLRYRPSLSPFYYVVLTCSSRQSSLKILINASSDQPSPYLTGPRSNLIKFGITHYSTSGIVVDVAVATCRQKAKKEKEKHFVMTPIKFVNCVLKYVNFNLLQDKCMWRNHVVVHEHYMYKTMFKFYVRLCHGTGIIPRS